MLLFAILTLEPAGMDSCWLVIFFLCRNFLVIWKVKLTATVSYDSMSYLLDDQLLKTPASLPN